MRSTTTKTVAATVAAVMISLTTLTTAAAATCAPRTELVRTLGERYGEARRAIALTNNGGLLEVFVSERGTWTILVSSPHGRSCVVAAGEAWQQQVVANPGPGA